MSEKVITIKAGAVGNLVDIQGIDSYIEVMLILNAVMGKIQNEIAGNSRIVMPGAANRAN